MSRSKKMIRPLPEPTVVAGSLASARPKLSQWAMVRPAALGFLLGMTATAMVYSRREAPPINPAVFPPPPITAVQPVFKQPDTFDELLAVSTADLGKVDLARMNLLCTEGLPGSENLNIPQCLTTLDLWTRAIKRYTANHYDEFLHDPTETHTWAEYRMMIIMSALSQGYGVHYDVASAIDEYGFDPATTKPKSVTDYYPTDNFDPSFFADSELFFINGLLGPKRDGTCSSLPVLVAVIAQRLGYPVTLVNTFRHTFVRWDDGKERFNIETTVVGGLQEVSDDEYCQWPRPLTAQMVVAEDYLQPLTPEQELACFLYSRVGCLLANGRLEEAIKLRPRCAELVPTSIKYTQLPTM
jgi:hypothetical protein